MSIVVTIELPDDAAPRKVKGVDDALKLARGLYHTVKQTDAARRDARIRFGWLLLQVKSQLPHGEFGAFQDRLAAHEHTVNACVKLVGDVSNEVLEGAGVGRRSQQMAMKLARAVAGDDGSPDPDKLKSIQMRTTGAHLNPSLRQLEDAVGARGRSPAERDMREKMQAQFGPRPGSDVDGVGDGKEPANGADGADGADGAAGSPSGSVAGDDDRAIACSESGGGALRVDDESARVVSNAPLVGEQLGLDSLYDQISLGRSALDDALSRFDDLDDDQRRRIAGACGVISDTISLSSAPLASDG